MTGGAILLRKELLESWRTLRLPIVAGLFLLVGLTSPLLARFLPEIIKAAAGDQLPTIPLPTPVAADAVDPDLEEPRPVRGVRRDRPGDGRRRHGTGSRHGRVRAVARRSRAAHSSRRRSSAIGAILACAPRWPSRSAWIYTAILFEPLPVARLDRAGGPRLARARGLGRADVPRQHRDRLDGGGGRDRVRGAAPPVDRLGDPERRPVPAGRAGRAGDRARVGRAGRCSRTCSSRSSRRSLLIAVAVGVAVWSFGRQEL